MSCTPRSTKNVNSLGATQVPLGTIGLGVRDKKLSLKEIKRERKRSDLHLQDCTLWDAREFLSTKSGRTGVRNNIHRSLNSPLNAQTFKY